MIVLHPKYACMLTTNQVDKKEAAALFKLIATEQKDKVKVDLFWEQLGKTGILKDDPRLTKLNLDLEASTKRNEISNQDFDAIIQHSAVVKKALGRKLIIPDFEVFCDQISQVFESVQANEGGKVADYIPQLARVNPDQFAVSICTIDGQRFSLGDAESVFCLQSSSKPVNYCLALEELGEEKVHEHVGREPSGQSFNELTLNHKGLPHNPLINAGAIMCCSLIEREKDMADRFDKVSKTWSQLCGNRPLHFNNAVYLSERATADRNFALAYFMRENDAFPPKTELTQTLEFYFQCCSIESSAADLAIATATLANTGTNPLTGDVIFQPHTVQNCLSLMLSCGMYDFSGEFAFRIGLPAKSGVSGVLLLVIPNVMGICIWSPRLDQHGNSVRGVEFCERLVEKFSFHHYDSLVGNSNKINPRAMAKETQVSRMVNAIYAASNGDIEELCRLYSEGLDLNLADYDGRTPLHLAAAEGQVEVIKFLIELEVDLQPTDRWGGTPIDDAEKGGHKEIMDLITQEIAKPKAARDSS